jgi:DNA-directed RNA polymerase specialized sigma24 family protein
MSSDLLSEESTEALIAYMQWRNEAGYEDSAINAFRSFFFRFQEELIKKTRVVARKWGYDNEVADIIAERAFDRFWRYPNFDIAKSKVKNYDKAVLIYLFAIAAHLLADYRKEQNGDISPFTGNEIVIREFPDIENSQLPNERKAILKERSEIIEKALARLTPKHKIIYLTYKQYEHDGNKLPRKLLESLRQELNLTQSSIQVYKKEAFDKVNEYLNIYG